ncbi:hypothetical protein VNI00_004563 [Paramarasmius palmivorus]|uniref:F-box domain-containing protein n=1 Tax=Paramarasmius palmivorus TaxID=297713 RepID=A0AAW0DJM7_9AGAR
MQLPPEILAHIFTFCVPAPGYAPIFIPPETGKARKAAIFGCFSFSRVCRTWRIISLNNRSLWTYPRFSIPDFANVMVERSKPALLDFHITFPERLVLPLLQDNLSRTRSLTVRTFSPVVLEWAEHATNPANNLKTLDIETMQSGIGSSLLPRTLFRGEAPLLTEIRLENCYLPWESALFSKVTILSLGGVDQRHNPSGMQFLAMLQGIPRLEVLKLKEVFPTTIVPEVPVLHIPHLRRLVLKMSGVSCTNVLCHISFPGTVSLFFDSYPDSEDAFDGLFPQFSQLYSPTGLESTGRRPLKSLALSLIAIDWEIPAIPTAGWAFNDITFPTQNSSALAPPDFKLTLSPSSHPPDFDFLPVDNVEVLGTLESLHLDCLETILLDGDFFPIVEDWFGSRSLPPEKVLSEFLDSLLWSTSIKALHVWGSRMAFPAILGLRAVESEPNGQEPRAAFPNLERLLLYAVNFSEEHEEKHLLDVLRSIVEFRSSRALTIPKLTLEQCQIRSEEVKELEQIFPAVEWDGATSMDEALETRFWSGIAQ